MFRKPRSRFEPFATVIGFCAALYVTALIVAFGSAALGFGRLWSLGERSICVTDVDSSFVSGGAPPVFRPGVAASPAGTSLCTNRATLGQQFLDSVTQIPTSIFYGGALVLLWWLLEGAKRTGPFSVANARRVRLIGWWFVVGGVVAASAEQVARNVLIDSMVVPSQAHGWWNALPAGQVSIVLTGLGLFVVAHILKVGVRMQDDLVGTV